MLSREGETRRLLLVRSRPFTLACGFMLMLGRAGPVVAQDYAVQQPSARQQLQHIHTPQSIDQELARLSKDLELTPEQQREQNGGESRRSVPLAASSPVPSSSAS
jgi:hypothetical protein